MLLLSPALYGAQRPNIVWIIIEDMSPHFGCYGEKCIATPHVDRLAAEGTRFSRAFVTGPICSISRSALITGMYQTSIGAHHHRSGRGTLKIHLPEGVEPVPLLFQRAGYWTSNGAWPPTGKGIGKTDYNFQWPPSMYDGSDWAGRKPGQPFFAQIQLHGGKYRDRANAEEFFSKALGALTPSDALPLPPYYPRTPEILEDWALTLDAVRYTDLQVGQILDRLQREGLLDSTVLFLITDHGVSHARGKQFLYDEGTHIPLIVRGPGIARRAVRDDLVEHIDLAATSLALAGIEVPQDMQARDVLAPDYTPREAVFAARDRADETVDHIRSVRTQRWKYIRNYLPQRPHLQPNNYKDHKRCLTALRQAQAAGLLDPVQEHLFAPNRPAEELYDLAADPWEIKNLAEDPARAGVLAELRSRLNRWIEETNDQGRRPEPPEMYDSDMEVYLGGKQNRNAEIERNIELMKRWAAEGK
jgi:arylsulfatase A-like enzyme